MFQPSGATPSPAPAAAPRPRVELPPEPPSRSRQAPTLLTTAPQRPSAIAKHRRARWPWGVAALVVLGALGGGAAWWLLPRRPPIPEGVEASRQQAFSLLRRDDAASRREALTQLGDMLQTFPRFVEARADLVLGLVLELDDQRAVVERMKAAAVQLERKIRELEDAQDGPDWREKVNALVREQQEIKAQSDPLVDALTALEAKVNDALRALAAQAVRLSEREELAFVRAQAMYYAVQRQAQALGLADEYERLGGKDGWGALARGELAANAGEKEAPQAEGRLKALLEDDASFVRAHVVLARIALARREGEQATAALEAATALNPNHRLARWLIDWTAKYPVQGR
jgi:hypothetical protein